jgi:prepilin-type N-terminal cleavage/methylation domain-containing protein
MNKQSGFTLIELLIVLAGLASLAIVVGMLYVAVHFISKFW